MMLSRCFLTAWAVVALAPSATHAKLTWFALAFETVVPFLGQPVTHPAAAPKAPLFEFVDAERATALVKNTGASVIDTRPVAKYLAGHIPGSVRLSDESVREAAGALPTAMLSPQRLGELFGRLGVSAETPVLVYADLDDPLSATIVAYALLKAGHPRVAVLDGGYSAWQGVGPSSQDFPTIEPKAWTATPNVNLAATLDDVRDVLRTEEAALVDARPPKSYRGEGKAWKRNGHIPGAVNLDWHSLVRPDNESLLKPAAAIRDLLKASKLSPDDRTIVYCGTGREATLLFLTLRATPGWKDVRLFEGSWTEYQSHEDLPAETGDEPSIPIRSDGTITTSGQPTERTLRLLADRGVKVVVNCRTPGENREVGFAERSLVESLGMRYAEIPLGGTQGYSERDVSALREILVQHGGTQGVHLHCAGGPRASTLWAAYLVKHEGLSPSAAVERLRNAGMLRESGLERLVGETLLPSPTPTK